MGRKERSWAISGVRGDAHPVGRCEGCYTIPRQKRIESIDPGGCAWRYVHTYGPSMLLLNLSGAVMYIRLHGGKTGLAAAVTWPR